MTLSLPSLIIAMPFVSAALLALVPSWRLGSWGNAAAASLLFLLTCLLPWLPRVQSPVLRVGTLEMHLTLLTSFIAMTTSWFGVRHDAAAPAQRRIDRLGTRVHHSAYQALVGALLGALLSDIPALTWFMLVVAVAAGAVLTGLPPGQSGDHLIASLVRRTALSREAGEGREGVHRTQRPPPCPPPLRGRGDGTPQPVPPGIHPIALGPPRSMLASAAAWRMLLHCGVGLLLALFGVLVLSLAAEPNGGSLHWSTIAAAAPGFHAAALDLACIFLVVGCGTLAGLVPLHSWLADAAAEGDAPGAIILSALSVNVPLLVILRVRAVVASSDSATALLLTLGLASLLLAACCLLSRLERRRVVAFSGMAQIGLVAFAFGLSTPDTIFAGVLLMAVLSLARASVLQCQDLSPTAASRLTGVVAAAVLLALPLLALLLIAGPTIEYAPWLMLPLGGGVLLVTWALAARLPDLGLPAATPARGHTVTATLALVPIWLQLAIAVVLAMAMPGPVVEWFQALAKAN